VLRFMTMGLALLTVQATAQTGAGSAVDIRQLQCDATPAPAAANAALSSAMPQASTESADPGKDFQAAILSDTTINGPARANAAAGGTSANDGGSSATGSSAGAEQTPSGSAGGVNRDASNPAGTIANRCGNTLNVNDGDKSKDLKILQVSPDDSHD